MPIINLHDYYAELEEKRVVVYAALKKADFNNLTAKLLTFSSTPIFSFSSLCGSAQKAWRRSKQLIIFEPFDLHINFN